MHVFWPAATMAFEDQGRGAIFVDTTSRPTGEGHPFGYYPQGLIEDGADEDVKRMVREYDPGREVVIVLLKSEDHTSTYRIHLR